MTKFLFLLTFLGLTSSAYGKTACLFGDEIGDLENNSRLEVKSNVIKTLKLSRLPDSENQVVAVQVSVITDKKTKNVYHMNTTFLHRDDGDNTIGWIEIVTTAFNDDAVEEDADRRVVAEIGDSSFGNCTVQVAVPK